MNTYNFLFKNNTREKMEDDACLQESNSNVTKKCFNLDSDNSTLLAKKYQPSTSLETKGINCLLEDAKIDIPQQYILGQVGGLKIATLNSRVCVDIKNKFLDSNVIPYISR